MPDFDEEDLNTEGGIQPLDVLKTFLAKLRGHYMLLIGLIGLFAILAILLAVIVPPSYTATAVVGPPSSSLSADVTTNGTTGGLAGIAASLSGGLLGQQANPFSTYTQLLTSARLNTALVQKKGLLETVFYKQYDNDKHEWLPNDGPIDLVVQGIERAFHYQIKDKPDDDDLARFFDKNMNVSTSLTSTFVTVTLDFHDQAQAEELLRTILVTADNIVREDMRADVSARLAYLNRELPLVTQTDQRNALISLLSGQQQMMMLIAADKRFAADFVDMPHADTRPTFPSLKIFGATAFLLAFAAWCVLVFGLPADHRILVYWQRLQKRAGTLFPRRKIMSWVRRRRGAESL